MTQNLIWEIITVYLFVRTIQNTIYLPNLTNRDLLYPERTVQNDSQGTISFCCWGTANNVRRRRLPISVVESDRSLTSSDHICSSQNIRNFPILIQESNAGHRLTDATNFSIMTGTTRSAARQDASKFVSARSSLTACWSADIEGVLCFVILELFLCEHFQYRKRDIIAAKLNE